MNTDLIDYSDADLSIIRRHFSEEIGWVAGIRDRRITDAFAKVPREKFLPPGPWRIYEPTRGYLPTRDADPRHVYHNVRICIEEARKLNNGEPGLTASVMQHAAAEVGERVLHVGCGTGYYTAIWAEIVGRSGFVCGVEIEEELARQAKVNLAPYPNVEVFHRDGSALSEGCWDVIVFSAGGNTVKRTWLEQLSLGGRLLMPFTLADRFGRLLRVVRHKSGYEAGFMPGEPITYYELSGARSDLLNDHVRLSVEKYGWFKRGSLYTGCSKPCDDCWLWLPEEEICISTRPFTREDI